MNIFGENKTNMHEEVKKMFKQTIFNMGANKFISLDHPQTLEEFGKYKAKLEIKSGPKQNKIDELVAKLLVELGLFQFNQRIKLINMSNLLQQTLQKSVIQRIIEEYK